MSTSAWKIHLPGPMLHTERHTKYMQYMQHCDVFCNVVRSTLRVDNIVYVQNSMTRENGDTEKVAWNTNTLILENKGLSRKIINNQRWTKGLRKKEEVTVQLQNSLENVWRTEMYWTFEN